MPQEEKDTIPEKKIDNVIFKKIDEKIIELHDMMEYISVVDVAEIHSDLANKIQRDIASLDYELKKFIDLHEFCWGNNQYINLRKKKKNT